MRHSAVTVAFHALAQYRENPFTNTYSPARQVSRAEEDIKARAMISFAVRTMTDASLPEIAKALRMRTHSSILHSLHEAEKLDRTELALFCLEVERSIVGDARVQFQRAASDPPRATDTPVIFESQRQIPLDGAGKGRRKVPACGCGDGDEPKAVRTFHRSKVEPPVLRDATAGRRQPDVLVQGRTGRTLRLGVRDE